MAGMFSDKPLKVTVNKAGGDGQKAALSFRWEDEGGADVPVVDALVRGDAARWAVGGPDTAAHLVDAARQSGSYMRMTSQLAEAEAGPAGYAMLVQVRVGARTYPLLLGVSQAADAPADTAVRLLANVTGTARSGFYSAFFALGPALDAAREACGGEPVTAQELGLDLPDVLAGKELTAFELVRNGLDDCRGAVVLDPDIERALSPTDR